MSDGNSIKIPTWALPIGAAIVSGAIAWGSMQAQASATADEVAEIKVKVEEADSVIKGQTVSSSFKPAILENGVRVMVPGHIERGTFIIIKTETLTYIERAKG